MSTEWEEEDRKINVSGPTDGSEEASGITERWITEFWKKQVH